MTIRVLLADDHEFFRAGFRSPNDGTRDRGRVGPDQVHVLLHPIIGAR